MALVGWEDARKVLMNETHRARVPFFTKHLEAGVRYNILTLQGREWKVQRTAIASAFKSTYDSQYRTIMVQVVANLVSTLKQRLQTAKTFDLDMEATMKMCTLDVFSLAAMGLDLGCCKTLEAFQFANEAEFLNSEIIRRQRHPLNPFCYFYSLPCDMNRKWYKSITSIRAYFDQHIQARKQQATDGSRKKDMDLFARLVKGHATAQKEMPGIVPDDALLDLVLAVMFAGFETTAITLSYAFYLISQHPEIQSVCLEEIRSLEALDNPDDLPYCKAVILETLRLYPAAVANSRTLQKPLQLSGGLVVAKGTTVLLPIWQMNRNEKTWPQPEAFRPDRWVREPNSQDKTPSLWVEREETDTSGTIAAANRKALFTFSAGGRSCPGQSFAMQESVLVLAGLLKDFQFTTPKGYVAVPVREGITQHPKDGMPMTAMLRN